ncbi:hypothetical protein CDD83_4727 [Cordyceps sp. RAO-2017]|nr:hypothetical protein CDD83_4727 [Cordyceps sp. RAO-2017]
MPLPPNTPLAAPTEARALRRVQSSSALSIAAASDGPELSEQQQAATASRWKTALEEAQFVAGGLISRPSESTKHYSIIRHSHLLVWYRGPSTSVSMTILSDKPLPATRTVWLQEKGYSGNVGMAFKAMVRSTAGWLDVTPVRRAQPEHLAPVDERGIQRDLERFSRKAAGRARHHVARETHVVRIPAAASDGYFRLVVCTGEGSGRKILCGSPVFRIASTTPDAAVVRGASLSTMPLEVGVKIATTVGQQVAKKYMGVAGMVVQNRAQKLMLKAPAAVKRAGQAAHVNYHRYGMADAVNEAWKNSELSRHDSQQWDMKQHLQPQHHSVVPIIGPNAGPELPFPVKFEGKVVPASGRSTAQLGVPTANLTGVPDEITTRFGGVFAAWAMVLPAKGLSDIANDWFEAVVTIAPPVGAAPTVAMNSGVCVHIAHDFDGATFFNAKLRVLLMASLHAASGPAPDDDPDAAAHLARLHVRDVMTTQASLGRESWSPHETIARMEAIRGQRALPDMLTEATGKVWQQVDRIPLHWAGVRSEAGARRDQMYGNGGMWIAR